MISYSWSQKEIILMIVDWLKNNTEMDVWLDEEEMRGDMLEKMAEAVEKCSVFLMAASADYKKSYNCRLEAQYATKRKKPIITLMVQGDYDPDGWLGLIKGYTLHYDFSKQEDFDTRMVELLKGIKEKHGEKGGDEEKKKTTPKGSTGEDGEETATESPRKPQNNAEKEAVQDVMSSVTDQKASDTEVTTDANVSQPTDEPDQSDVQTGVIQSSSKSKARNTSDVSSQTAIQTESQCVQTSEILQGTQSPQTELWGRSTSISRTTESPSCRRDSRHDRRQESPENPKPEKPRHRKNSKRERDEDRTKRRSKTESTTDVSQSDSDTDLDRVVCTRIPRSKRKRAETTAKLLPLLLRDWAMREFRRRIESHGLKNLPSLKHMEGDELLFLCQMYRQAPDSFYRVLTTQLRVTSLKEIAAVSLAVAPIAETLYPVSENHVTRVVEVKDVSVPWWRKDRVTQWLMEHSLYHLVPLRHLSGSQLVVLKTLKHQSPETFYQCLTTQLQLTSPRHIVKVIKAIDRLPIYQLAKCDQIVTLE